MMRGMRLLLLGMLVACGTKRPQVSPDAPDPCDACGLDLCVQRFDGTCGLATQCVPRAATCHDPALTGACSQACQDAYCPAPTTCMNRVPCSGAAPSAKAFTCYGP